MKFKILTLSIVLVFILPGCTTLAPEYPLLVDNVQELRRAGETSVFVGEFKADPENKDTIEHLSLRGGSFQSPYKKSYAEYLKEAIKSELYHARRYSVESETIISGILLTNTLAAGSSIGEASISARIIVIHNNSEIYNKIISVSHTWESYFAAFSAVPAAQIGYTGTIQKFTQKLYSDADFVGAINSN